MAVFVTGTNGQLGKFIQKRAFSNLSFEFIFLTSKELYITYLISVIQIFNLHDFDFCINFAADTNVD